MATVWKRVLISSALLALLCFAAQRYNGHGHRRPPTSPIPVPRTTPDEIIAIRKTTTPSGHADAAAAGCLPLAREAAAGTRRNFVVSPLSIHAALAFVAAGRQLLEFLGAPSLDALHGAPAMELLRELNGLNQTSFASGIWVDRRRALMPEFMAIGGEAAVDSSTLVVLANALYFKGTWSEQPFDPSATLDAPFHTPDGTVVRVPFMTDRDDKLVAAYPGFKALKLPYKSDDGDGVRRSAAAFYMLLLLPDNNTTTMKLSDLYDQAVSTPGFIKDHTPAVKVPVGRFMVPKFKFTFEFEASSDMRKLGLTKPFDRGDFSGMVSGRDVRGITGVYHKATIEVDELGTVAAAATAIVIDATAIGARKPPRPRVDFVADHLFLFAIVEERSSTVLFLGHVVNPLHH
ncbi:hypothetical protein BRADI_4g23062v3 [Brachypodium distachyon]|uniref:Serpin domain-containing protein n=1 Tax=Brachypodium distachyon TaxID=15368 RepID=A0A0Q3L902_BRADI|nr:hypothetical protein BRADI_4g23062v3 [Brachypodium distachyon]